ncbi:YciI family protein [Nocardiopsis ganjiahuensis]|uniref:YciI family protein n=1 Tax=Nocardiopsis ganjiahuensis TaxID=239984 RepID=UPI00034AB0F8|nr:YciI family protein [Nocardiopsis ganjiahuensis]
MKYLIMMHATQQDLDMLEGTPNPDPARNMSPEQVQDLYTFMEEYHKKLEESGELVDAQGLSAPSHARRVTLRGGSTVVTDGPYAETEEVLVGYTIVDCASYDRATEIAADLLHQGFEGEYVDVRPISGGIEDTEV